MTVGADGRGVWFENSGSTVGLHALVIGVSEYVHSPRGLDDLPGAAFSAAAVATWLRDEYPTRAPADAGLRSLRLLLSPTSAERNEIARLPGFAFDETGPADRSAVLEALGAWAADCRSDKGNVALLYVAGHGLQQSAENGLVLLADNGANTAQQWDEAIDLGRVRSGLSNGPDRQWYFVDACRIAVSDAEARTRIEGHVGLDNEGGAGPAHCPMFFSSLPNTESFFTDRGGFFTQALLECLKLDAFERSDDGSAWMVTTEDLRKTLYNTTGALAGSHLLDQRPSLGGTYGEAPLLVTDDLVVPYTVHLDPPDAEPHAQMRIFDGDHNVDIVPRTAFPVENVPTRAGFWNLDIDFDPADATYGTRHTTAEVRPRKRTRQVPLT